VLAWVHRIVQGDQLRHVARSGTKAPGRLFTASTVVRGDSDPSRFGFIVSKQVGGAVVRNLVKRRLRALAAQTLREHPCGMDTVIRAQAPSAGASFDELSVQWERMVSKTMVAP